MFFQQFAGVGKKKVFEEINAVFLEFSSFLPLVSFIPSHENYLEIIRKHPSVYKP